MHWLTAPPAIVAEALVGVPDPLLTALHPGSPAAGSVVASSLARSLAPPEDPGEPPPWLLPQQAPSFRRVLAAVRRYGGAVLADPVGSGKTYVALAVAAALNHSPTACLVPATLLGQWQAASARVDVPVRLCSHERVSRGCLPQSTRGLVIIDESHHFKNPRTSRYRHLSPWLIGRPALLVTATPVVNRVADLAHQLLLVVRDNTLALDGVGSLRALLGSGRADPALGRLVVEGEPVSGGRPARSYHLSRATAAEGAALTCLLEQVARLRLSRCTATAALIRNVLLRAAGSSPAALRAALRRYRRLLLHARDAFNAGQRLDRAELRRFTGELGDQLIWWELLPPAQASSEIDLDDLPELEDLIGATERACNDTDEKLARLHRLLNDGTPSLVFTAFRDTVRYIRDRLPHPPLAWCTGERAGIGAVTLPRRAVLAWFREPTASSLAPQHLIVTDVAAEGLDLQRAARVVHYDLPWTPMRLEQREGRSVRYGSQHSRVEVVRFLVPHILERSLRVEAMLARKARLPASAGLGPEGGHLWRWRGSLAERFGRGEARAGVAAVHCPEEGLLAGFTLHSSAETEPLSATVLWLEPSGSWTEAPDLIAARLAIAAEQSQIVPVSGARMGTWLSLLAMPIRDRLTLTRSRRWLVSDPAPAARRLVARLQQLIRDAARRHRAARLVELERALAFVAGGHTAGEAALVERLADAPDRELEAAAGRLPKALVLLKAIDVRITGLVVFGPAQEDGSLPTAEDISGQLPSVPCAGCRPPSSISTEP